MPLRQCLRETSYRDYLTWQAYLEQEWERPSRTDHYLMQIAREVKRTTVKKPRLIELGHFLLTFVKKKRTKSQLSPEDIRRKIERSKSVWKSALLSGTKNHVRRK